jgi:iron-sulfur cluster assembly protein
MDSQILEYELLQCNYCKKVLIAVIMRETGVLFMESIISITEKAIQQIEAISKEENPDGSKGLRLAVTGGGCSGLSYKIEFSEAKEKDNVLQFGEIKVLIDPKSVIYLKGIVLDFKDGLNGKGFVFDNPNAKNTCGCGESFSL